MKQFISVVIPVLNEESCLQSSRDYFAQLGEVCDLIFVDGGSQDRTIELASQWGRVFTSEKGRGVQKHMGVQQAQHDILFFLHVDTQIDMGVLQRIRQVVDEGVAAGTLTMYLDDRSMLFRFFETMVNFMARCFKVTDGDLGLFIRKDFYEELGGFPAVVMMEDILLGQQLHKRKDLLILPEKIRVSARKWRDKGLLRTFFQYTKAYWRLWIGDIKAVSQEGSLCESDAH